MCFTTPEMILRFTLQNLKVPEDLKDAHVHTHYVVEYDGLPCPGLILYVDGQMTWISVQNTFPVRKRKTNNAHLQIIRRQMSLSANYFTNSFNH